VVNEAIDWDGHKWGLKNATPWYPTLPTYVDDAFKFARAADPEAQLFYNDFGVVDWNKGKRDAIYDMIKGMQNRGIPIDGVGL
jgi:endo-1,4-beta-xylanase